MQIKLTPFEALQIALTAPCRRGRSQPRRPGEVVEALPVELRQVLEALTSDDVVSVRADEATSRCGAKYGRRSPRWVRRTS